LAAEQCVIVSVLLLAVLDDQVELVFRKVIAGPLLLDPAAMAAEIALVGEGHEHEGGIQLPLFEALLVGGHGPHSLVGAQIGAFQRQARGNLGGDAIRQPGNDHTRVPFESESKGYLTLDRAAILQPGHSVTRRYRPAVELSRVPKGQDAAPSAFPEL